MDVIVSTGVVIEDDRDGAPTEKMGWQVGLRLSSDLETAGIVVTPQLSAGLMKSSIISIYYNV